jgi:hypothetical protein
MTFVANWLQNEDFAVGLLEDQLAVLAFDLVTDFLSTVENSHRRRRTELSVDLEAAVKML